MPSSEERGPTGRIRLCDVTLREGEQGVDFSFTVEEKVEIAQHLARAGVDLIQVGHPWADRDTIAALRAAGVRAPLEAVVALSRDDWARDVDAAAAQGVGSVQLVTRVGSRQLAASGISPSRMVSRVTAACERVSDLGMRACAGLAYASDADPGFLRQVAGAVTQAGAARIVAADSLGHARPGQMASLVALLREAGGVPVGAHCHNDFGLALALSLESVEAGAEWVDVSVLGVGERSGNASLEEVAASLTLLLGRDCAVDLTRLRPVAGVVSRALRLSIPPYRPVVGSAVFASKLDIHVEGLQREQDAFLPYPPELVGGTFEVRVGVGSGRSALRAALARADVEVGDAELPALLDRVRSEALQEKRALSDERLRELAQPHSAAGGGGGRA